MNSHNTEINRLSGTVPELNPSNIGTDKTVEVFDVHCPSNVNQVLRVARQVLTAVLQNFSRPELTERNWETLLDETFVKRCGPHQTGEELQRLASLSLDERLDHQQNARWSLKAFLNAFDPDLGLREWEWWDAKIINPSLLEVTVVVPWDFFLWQSLRWLFIGSGAIDISPHNAA